MGSGRAEVEAGDRPDRQVARRPAADRQAPARGAPGLQQLQRSIGNRAVCNLVTSGAVVVQRDLRYGNDPQTGIAEDSPDLLYGINIPRAQTKGRLSDDQRKRLRTIDDYNRAIGINAIIKGTTAAMALYDVRAQLASTGAWGLTMDATLNTVDNQGSIQLWIDYLRAHAAHIGLEDLGSRSGPLVRDKINTKDRFKKNRKESQANQPKADRLTPSETRDFLAPTHTKTTAQNVYDAMSPAKQAALNEWVYRAFFRRTSKLGQDFTVKVLGGMVHFNTVADPDYKPLLGPQWKDKGLEKMSKSGKNDKNRAITVSEYRHMKKLAKQHPGSFNVYGEI
ncbi:MAG TPA: hypothetical protein VFN68_16420 [Acidimicrobiales bacterium]|nr:hypothetical protein [Acidimicrobiales bacterium]